MFTPFHTMPEDSRIWVYQSDRPFSVDEVIKIKELMLPFIENWTAHNQQLAAGYEIRYNRFILIGIDEKMALASGCSIDKSVNIIRQLEQELNVTLMNRNLFAFKENDQVVLLPRKLFEEKIINGVIKDDTTVFNNLVDRKEKLITDWEVPFSKSWHKQLFAPLGL